MRSGNDTRNLAPPISADDHGVPEVGEDPTGGKTMIDPMPAANGEATEANDSGLPQEAADDHEDGDISTAGAGAPLKFLDPSGDGHSSSDSDTDDDGAATHAAPLPIELDIPQGGPPAAPNPPAGGEHGAEAQPHPSAEGEDDDAAHDTPHDATDDLADPLASADSGAIDEDAADGVNSIAVTQTAIVDQDASIEVTGYVGEVSAHLYIDQDLMMDQNVNLSFTIDGDGHFSVQIDQDMVIEQAIDVDVKIWDEDGVLYIDVYLKDAVSVEQDTDVDAEISDGHPGGSVAINQDLTLDQDVDIDIDIEDDVAERYAVTVGVDVHQDVVAVQDADVDVKDWNGEVELDIDAAQTAYIDQQTVVHADFVMV